MRRALLIALTFAPLAARAEAAGGVSAGERARVVKHLEETRAKFLASVRGLSPQQSGWRSAEGRWTIAEVAEHIALTEAAIHGMVEQVLKSPPAPEKKAEVAGKDERILERIPNRANKAQAPEVLKPKNTFGSLEETVKAFEKGRAANLEIARSSTQDLRSHFAPHPFFGALDTYQWLLFVSAHSDRHTQQIEEVKAQSGYPK
jgi:hypothetical protein